MLVTGAAGYVAGQLLPALAERYDLVLVDVTSNQRNGHQLGGVEFADRQPSRPISPNETTST